ncbi:PREDICTED: uncharacterized protein LOC107094084 [Cyprinodon variegatus]|uniref:uncharacterized protein LOC107094084 n=1 Tax=Cyprinodon variegatus TaxID=28743 RepID=UPI00074253F9|nr:PREDICTED: uncharacterized protein LOC107094084 [Cyprinodon variegatus]
MRVYVKVVISVCCEQGCGSSAPESGTSRRMTTLTHKPLGRHACCSLFLDPYDGSSEDSDVSSGGTVRLPRPHGKGGHRRRLFPHSSMTTDTTRASLMHRQGDARVKHGRCSEEGCRRIPDESENIHAMDVEVQLDDSGLEATRSSTCCTPGLYISEERSSPQMLSSSSGRSLRPLSKRKELPPEAEPVEAELRKRRCVVNTADERGEPG